MTLFDVHGKTPSWNDNVINKMKKKKDNFEIFELQGKNIERNSKIPKGQTEGQL